MKSAQRLGFTLQEVCHLLRLEDGTHCEEAAGLARERLRDVRERLQDLARMEAALAGLVECCVGQSAAGPCPLIAALQEN
ncbi:MerR family DNA-binding protein [Acidihalobacter aeolianus]